MRSFHCCSGDFTLELAFVYVYNLALILYFLWKTMHFLSRATIENLSKVDISPILQKSTANIICHLFIMQKFFWLEISVI